MKLSFEVIDTRICSLSKLFLLIFKFKLNIWILLLNVSIFSPISFMFFYRDNGKVKGRIKQGTL